ncbi:CvfB family protein [Bacillus testis]|uniref:CvfB family protein n=1 Tax=Bacillus testis TaxID=1622072 RepID=UPI00067F6BE9|nr:S1-like domain-containing RNA-binding protein [Bacillus testis]
MSRLVPGDVVTLQVERQAEYGFFLKDPESGKTVLLHRNQIIQDIEIGMEIEVFLYQDKDVRLTATMRIPEIRNGVYGWGEVAGYRKNLGVFVDIGVETDMLVSVDELPIMYNVWPKRGDRLYITLRTDKNGRLFGKLADEDTIYSISKPAPESMYNRPVKGYIYKTKKVGSYLFTEEGYICFIHESQREKEPRLGQYVEGRVIDEKEDGTLNVSLLPFKQEKMQGDSEIILQYLEIRGGAMPYGDKTDPDTIMKHFEMSKGAFKRALGKLMKEGKIYQEDGWTYTSDRR